MARQFGAGLMPVAGALAQRLQNHSFERLRQQRVEDDRRQRIPMHHGVEQQLRMRLAERRSSRRQLVQNHTKTKDVSSRVEWLTGGP